MGMNVLFDLLSYSAEIDGAVLSGKSVKKSAPMSVADMTAKGKFRG